MQAIKKGLLRPRGLLQLSETIPANITEMASATLAHMITTPMNLGPTPITSVQNGIKYTLATRDAHEMALPKHVKVAILAFPISSGSMGSAVVAAGNPSAPPVGLLARLGVVVAAGAAPAICLLLLLLLLLQSLLPPPRDAASEGGVALNTTGASAMGVGASQWPSVIRAF